MPNPRKHKKRGPVLFTVFDTETTGLIANRSMKLDRQPEIIEFAAATVDLDSGEVFEEVSFLIKPKNPIPEKNEKITGITNKMVENSPPFEAFEGIIRGLLATADVVVAHNARFDVDMIDIELERMGTGIAWPEVVCSIEATSHLAGKSLNLGALHEILFGKKHEGAHRAKDDVAGLVNCLVELRARGEFPYGSVL